MNPWVEVFSWHLHSYLQFRLDLECPFEVLPSPLQGLICLIGRTERMCSWTLRTVHVHVQNGTYLPSSCAVVTRRMTATGCCYRTATVYYKIRTYATAPQTLHVSSVIIHHTCRGYVPVFNMDSLRFLFFPFCSQKIKMTYLRNGNMELWNCGSWIVDVISRHDERQSSNMKIDMTNHGDFLHLLNISPPSSPSLATVRSRDL